MPSGPEHIGALQMAALGLGADHCKGDVRRGEPVVLDGGDELSRLTLEVQAEAGDSELFLSELHTSASLHPDAVVLRHDVELDRREEPRQLDEGREGENGRCLGATPVDLLRHPNRSPRWTRPRTTPS